MRILLLMSVWLLSGCTLVIGGVELADCSEDPVQCSCVRDTDCSRYDDSADACVLYRCDEAAGRCEQVALDADDDGYVSDKCGGDDCKDADKTAHPGAAELCDGDDTNCDGTLDGPKEDVDRDGYAGACAGEASKDCDDNNPDTYWDAPELCDGYDNNCLLNGARRRTWGQEIEPDEDADGDRAIREGAACTGPIKEVDCADNDSRRYPSAIELCDGVDTNCRDGLDGPDEDDDGDGRPDACANSEIVDCDDTNPDTYPGAPEKCDLFDNDCSETNATDPTSLTQRASSIGRAEPAEDRDGDGRVGLSAACVGGVKDDCDDRDAMSYAGAFEACDNKDNDCDGVLDNVPLDTRVGSTCIPTAVSAGARHTCVIQPDRKVVCWGSHTVLLAATANLPSGSVNALLIGGVDDAVELASGEEFTCARSASGDVACWGKCSITRAEFVYDDRADPNNLRCSEAINPRMAAPDGTVLKATQITAGKGHACALRDDGSVWCWGEVCRFDDAKFPGILSCPFSFVPVEVVAARGMRSLAAGGIATCGLYEDGRVGCFQFKGESNARVEVMDVPIARSLSCAGWECCALHEAGNATCFEPLSIASESCVAAGDCDTIRKVYVQGVPPGAQSVVSSNNAYPTALAVDPQVEPRDNELPFLRGSSEIGDIHCFLHASGEVSCSGQQLLWSTPDAPLLTPALAKVRSLSLGQSHGCALTDEGLVCWGENANGDVGDGRPDFIVQRVPKRVSVIAQALVTRAGELTTCALLPNRELRCAQPRAAFTREASDVLAFDLEGDPMPGATARRYEVLCVVGLSGASYCRGDRGGGGLFTTPVRIGAQVLRSDLQSLFAAADRMVALTQDGHVLSAPLPLLEAQGSSEPLLPNVTLEAVVDPQGRDLQDVLQVDCGLGHCCARTASDVLCWGANDQGQLGSRSQDRTGSARRVTLPSGGVPIDLSVHANRSCAVLAGDGVYCWGERLPSDLPGDGGPVVERTERTTDAEAVSVGGRHVCARLRSGQVRCWGQSALGVEDGSVSSRLPLNVQGLIDARDLGCGADHCCATRTSGQTLCWGLGVKLLGSGDQSENLDAVPPSGLVDLLGD